MEIHPPLFRITSHIPEENVKTALQIQRGIEKSVETSTYELNSETISKHKKVEHRQRAVLFQCEVTDYGSDSKFIGTEVPAQQ